MAAPTIVWLRDGVGFVAPAAAAWARLEARLGRRAGVNSTYRDYNLQLSMWRAWLAYQAGTGPYPGHSRALHPDESMHCAGLAVDTNEWTTPGFIDLAAEYGFIRTAANDPTERHHFEYQSWMDRHKNEPANTGSSESFNEEDEMNSEQDKWLRSLYMGIFGVRNVTGDATPLRWTNIWGDAQSSNYGLLPLVLHNQTLIAKNVGEISALKELVAQLSDGIDVVIDYEKINDAAEAGVREALADWEPPEEEDPKA
jgi:hypothetical protein